MLHGPAVCCIVVMISPLSFGFRVHLLLGLAESGVRSVKRLRGEPKSIFVAPLGETKTVFLGGRRLTRARGRAPKPAPRLRRHDARPRGGHKMRVRDSDPSGLRRPVRLRAFAPIARPIASDRTRPNFLNYAPRRSPFSERPSRLRRRAIASLAPQGSGRRSRRIALNHQCGLYAAFHARTARVGVLQGRARNPHARHMTNQSFINPR
jgi:hypothetical protein